MADVAYRIEPLTLLDLEEVVRLHDIYLDYGDAIRPHFLAALGDPETVGYKCTVHGEMVGLCICTPGIALSGGHEDLCAQIRARVGDARTYTGDALLITEPYRKTGILADLCRTTSAGVRAKGAQYVLGELWVYPDGRMPGKHLLSWFGPYEDLGLYANFYRDFDHFGRHCPICKGPCKCSAHLYLSHVAEGETHEAR